MFKDFANVWTIVGLERDLKSLGRTCISRKAWVMKNMIDRPRSLFVRCSIIGLDLLNGSKRSGIFIAAPDRRRGRRAVTTPDTIFALGTGPGRAAIAVIRISGPGAGDALKALAGKLPEPRQASFAILRDPQTGEMLDRGLALFFPGPASSTGEDYGELQLHGGRAVVEGALAALHRLPGLRPAEPGEFARRSFANGKLDLSQAEALADLIDAQTEAQRRQALRVAGGALRRKVEGWRAALVESLALVEAELDFSDEADVGAFSPARLGALLSPLAEDMRAALQLAPASERMRDGFVVMILGRPNVGKSTLINALTRRDLAIVSPIPGTTRDMIEAHLDIGGLPVTLIDTAGLREAADAIERIGVDRTLARVETADLALWLSRFCGGAAGARRRDDPRRDQNRSDAGASRRDRRLRLERRGARDVGGSD